MQDSKKKNPWILACPWDKQLSDVFPGQVLHVVGRSDNLSENDTLLAQKENLLIELLSCTTRWQFSWDLGMVTVCCLQLYHDCKIINKKNSIMTRLILFLIHFELNYLHKNQAPWIQFISVLETWKKPDHFMIHSTHFCTVTTNCFHLCSTRAWDIFP